MPDEPIAKDGRGGLKNNGKALEKAVRLIQETLLESDPSLKGGQFTITPNKIITVGGTRHEVDLYVVTQPGTSYESIVLFECKDWKEPVSKNDVIILKEKVDLLGATRGILVAPQLTKDAEALLSQYKRVQFRRSSEEIKSMFGIDVVHTMHDSLGTTVRITPRNPTQSFPSDFKNAICHWGDKISTFQKLCHEQVELIAHLDKLAQMQKYDSESAHWYDARQRFDFFIGECTVSGIDVVVLEIDVIYLVTVGRGSPCYRCSIDGEGEFLSFEIVHDAFPSRRLELNVVITESKKSSGTG